MIIVIYIPQGHYFKSTVWQEVQMNM